MKQPIAAETLSEDFFGKIEISIEAVAFQVSYIHQGIFSIDFSMVETLGIYYDGSKERRMESTIDKTWKILRASFLESSRRFGPYIVHPKPEGTPSFVHQWVNQIQWHNSKCRKIAPRR